MSTPILIEVAVTPGPVRIVAVDDRDDGEVEALPPGVVEVPAPGPVPPFLAASPPGVGIVADDEPDGDLPITATGADGSTKMNGTTTLASNKPTATADNAT